MAGRFDRSLINQIQQATDIVEVVSEHLSLERKGKEFLGLCPFHADHKPSMYVNPAKQIFKCFACGAGGDVFKFVQLREGLGFSDAIERLAKRVGIKVKPSRASGSGGQKGSQEADSKTLLKVNEWALKFWQGNLSDEQGGAKGRKYVADRKISADIAKEWGLGLAKKSWDELFEAGKKKEITARLLEEAGLVVASPKSRGDYYDKFRDRLIFPILDVSERVIGFGGRTLGDDPAKYMNSPATALFDKSNCIYGLDKARHQIVSSGVAVVVEGYTDCMMAHQFGCRNVVATLGTSFTRGHGRILRRYAKKIVLVFDSDIAGVEAANRALEVCLLERIDIKLAWVPEGKDPCEFILAAGKDRFEELVAAAVDVMAFKWERLLGGFEAGDNFADRRGATEEFLQTVAMAIRAGNIGAIDKGLIVNRLAKIIGLGSEEINAELARRSSRVSPESGYAVRNQKVVSIDLGRGSFAKAQQEVLAVLLNEPGLFEKVRQRVSVDSFTEPMLKSVAEIVFEVLVSEPEACLTDFLSRTESVDVGAAIVELAERGQEKGNFDIRLEHGAEEIERCRERLVQDKMLADLDDDDTESLRIISERLSKRKKNWRNPGMVSM